MKVIYISFNFQMLMSVWLELEAVLKIVSTPWDPSIAAAMMDTHLSITPCAYKKVRNHVILL